MAIIYEQIMDALLLRLQTLCGDTFTTYSRRFINWENVIQYNLNGQPIRQPALFLYDGIGFGGGMNEIQQRGRGTPKREILERTIVVYALMPDAGTDKGPDALTPGGSVLAPLYQSVLNAFAAEVGDGPGGTLTLGGLCSHCWVEGRSHWLTPEIDPSGQGMFTIPINILIP